MAGEWDVHGKWELVQANGWHVHFDLQQAGEVLKGSAFGQHPAVSETMSGTGRGQVSGGAPGAQFVFTVTWQGSQEIKARYTATFDPFGGLSGVTFREDDAGVQSTWISIPDFGHV
jgi:hypothetical protein